MNDSETSWPSSAKYSIIFLVLHVAGALFALWTLSQAWDTRLVLEIIWGKLAWFSFFCILVTALLGVQEASRAFSRLRKRETEPDVGLRLRGLLYVAVACLFLDVTILWIPFPQIANISITFAYGAYVLWQKMLPRIRRKVFPRLRRGLDVACMNVALGLILAEVSLRIVAVVWPMPLLMTNETTEVNRIAANRISPGFMRYGFPTNEGGHYDTPFEAKATRVKKVVVSIGDSFANGVVPHHYHFSTVCERELPDVAVYNMGFPAIGPKEYRALLKDEALQLKPELVVFHLFIGNDLTDVLAGDVGTTHWYDADRYMVPLLWKRIQILIREKRIDMRKGLRDAVPEHSLGMAKSSAAIEDALVTRFPWLENALMEKPTFSHDVFVRIELQRAKDVCVSNEFIYQRFFESLRELQRSAEGIPIAFVLIPDEFQVNDDLWEKIVHDASLSDQSLDRDLPQRKIVKWLEGRNLPVLDLLPLLRAVEPLEDGKRHVFHLQDTHFNLRGNDVAGRSLASFLKPILSGEWKPELVTPSPQATSTASQYSMSNDEAAGILQQFGTVIKSVGADGTTVFDDSLLDHPKDQIKAAIVTVLNGEIDAGQKDYSREAARVLAFFQSGVGKARVSIDAIRSDQRTWRSMVEAEMLEIEQEMVSRTKGQN